MLINDWILLKVATQSFSCFPNSHLSLATKLNLKCFVNLLAKFMPQIWQNQMDSMSPINKAEDPSLVHLFIIFIYFHFIYS